MTFDKALDDFMEMLRLYPRVSGSHDRLREAVRQMFVAAVRDPVLRHADAASAAPLPPEPAPPVDPFSLPHRTVDDLRTKVDAVCARAREATGLEPAPPRCDGTGRLRATDAVLSAQPSRRQRR